jgi:hypothetical protein
MGRLLGKGRLGRRSPSWPGGGKPGLLTGTQDSRRPPAPSRGWSLISPSSLLTALLPASLRLVERSCIIGSPAMPIAVPSSSTPCSLS